VRDGEHSTYAIKDWQKAFNIRALAYGPEHEDLVGELKDLLDRVDDYRRTNPQG
jgi:hypothetical protein